ncbi:MAG: hypothetical protein QOI13_441, partial [Paraburkholderia sp.]|nr:hypothetical protein [Paraburkholderia sp.]
MKQPTHARPRRTPRLVARFVAVSWRDLAVSFGPILAASAVAIWVAIRLIQPAPPSTLTITAGPPGSTFWNAAERYKQILARNGITLKVLASEGSLQNLQRLSDPSSHVDVGFVQGGLLSIAASAGGASGAAASNAAATSTTSASESSPSPTAVANPAAVPDGIVSLGSVAYVPLVVFYNGSRRTLLSEFAGKRLAIGPEGSGARALALVLLKANGIVPGGSTTLLPLTGEEAARALKAGSIDAAFFSGDSAQLPVMVALTRTRGVRFFSFAQAQAYARRFPYLTDVALPMGAFDLGKNLPPETVHTLSSTADLIARDTLHPALSDLL